MGLITMDELSGLGAPPGWLVRWFGTEEGGARSARGRGFERARREEKARRAQARRRAEEAADRRWRAHLQRMEWEEKLRQRKLAAARTAPPPVARQPRQPRRRSGPPPLPPTRIMEEAGSPGLYVRRPAYRPRSPYARPPAYTVPGAAAVAAGVVLATAGRGQTAPAVQAPSPQRPARIYY
jgi:hypothetical protein